MKQIKQNIKIIAMNKAVNFCYQKAAKKIIHYFKGNYYFKKGIDQSKKKYNQRRKQLYFKKLIQAHHFTINNRSSLLKADYRYTVFKWRSFKTMLNNRVRYKLFIMERLIILYNFIIHKYCKPVVISLLKRMRILKFTRIRSDMFYDKMKKKMAIKKLKYELLTRKRIKKDVKIFINNKKWNNLSLMINKLHDKAVRRSRSFCGHIVSIENKLKLYFQKLSANKFYSKRLQYYDKKIMNSKNTIRMMKYFLKKWRNNISYEKIMNQQTKRVSIRNKLFTVQSINYNKLSLKTKKFMMFHFNKWKIFRCSIINRRGNKITSNFIISKYWKYLLTILQRRQNNCIIIAILTKSRLKKSKVIMFNNLKKMIRIRSVKYTHSVTSQFIKLLRKRLLKWFLFCTRNGSLYNSYISAFHYNISMIKRKSLQRWLKFVFINKSFISKKLVIVINLKRSKYLRSWLQNSRRLILFNHNFKRSEIFLKTHRLKSGMRQLKFRLVYNTFEDNIIKCYRLNSQIIQLKKRYMKYLWKNMIRSRNRVLDKTDHFNNLAIIFLKKWISFTKKMNCYKSQNQLGIRNNQIILKLMFFSCINNFKRQIICEKHLLQLAYTFR